MGNKVSKYVEHPQIINTLVSEWEQLLNAVSEEPSWVQSCPIFSFNSLRIL